MHLNITNVILTLLGITLILCFVLNIMDKLPNSNIETFDQNDPVINAIQSQLQNQTPDQLKNTIQTLQQRLIDYGYAPNLNNYVTKTELSPNSGKCIVDVAEDRDKYISKSDVPSPGPRIDLSQYVKKSSIPPAPVCPPAQEIDYSQYVKKSTLPPHEKCPPCIAPKVKVSAGLCRECPPPPACPVPEPCPQLRCPEPAPCPTLGKCRPCDEIRYIKVPAIITKTIIVDSYGNVVSQNIDSGNAVPTQAPQNLELLQESQATQSNIIPQNTQAQQSLMNSLFGYTNVTEAALMPSATTTTTQPNFMPSTTTTTTTTQPNYVMPSTTLAQTLGKVTYNKDTKSFCPSPDLNSEFKSYGIYGP